MLVRRTPEQIKKFLRDNQHRMDLPELWVGDEPNTYGPWNDMSGRLYKNHDYYFDPKNDKDVVRFVHMTCWDLVQTAGNQTVPLLNQIVNDFGKTHLAERGAFPPTRHDVKIFDDGGMPPFSLESKHTIFTDFDIVGTTLAFPGFYPNLLKQLRSAGVPPRWEDRDATDELFPIIFCGGQIFAQPGPIEPVVDVVVVGEGEDGVSGSDGDVVGFPTLLLDVIAAKKDGSWYTKSGRLDLLHNWAREHHWCFVPRYYEYKYADPRSTKRHFISYSRKFDDIPAKPKRRWIYDLDTIPSVVNPIVNAHDPSMGLGEIEASRSCTGKCSFCAEIYRYTPYREKSVEKLVKDFAENIKWSGSTNAFPTGFDFPCYSRKNELYVRLLSEVCSDVDTQSSRVDHFVDDPEWAKKAGQGGMRQLAVGVEGNSERLRMIMSKGATEEKILDAVRYAIESKFDKVKFFMIADWEWETQQDTDEIIELGRKIMEMKKTYGSNITVRFSWTPLLIEAWTPLQWCRAVVEDKKLVGVYDRLKPLGIGFTLGKKTERNYYYFMQAFHMADRLLADVMIRVAEKLDQVYCGAVDRKWIETMEVEMEKIGLTWDHYFRKKDIGEDFWWDLIDLDLPKKWFLDYYKKMIAMAEATDPSKNPNKPLPQRSELVEIGQAITKKGGPRFQANLLQKGMLVANCDTACCACMGCETGVKEGNEVKTSGKVDFYKNVMKPVYWESNSKKDEQFKDKIVVPMDDRSITDKIRCRIQIDDDKRFMPNVFWIAAIRRAAYLADIPISKFSIQIASSVHGYKAYIGGSGYLEFGVVSKPNLPVEDILNKMNIFAPIGLKFVEGKYVGRDSVILQRGVDYEALFNYVLDTNPDKALQQFRQLAKAEEFEMSVKRDEYRKGLSTVKMNIHDWLKDAWLSSNGHELRLNMIMKYGEPTPYNIAAAVFGMSAADSHARACRIEDIFVSTGNQTDFFIQLCIECGDNIPMNIMAKPFHPDYCPKCVDKVNGRLLSSFNSVRQDIEGAHSIAYPQIPPETV